MANRNAWLKNPRKKKMVTAHSRVTKKGDVQIIDPYEHEYPTKLKPVDPKKERAKKPEEDATKQLKKPEEETKRTEKPEEEMNRLKPNKDQNEVDKAKDNVACKLGV